MVTTRPKMTFPSDAEILTAVQARTDFLAGRLLSSVGSLPSDESFAEALNYAVSGGKRVRPYLLLSVGRGLGAGEDKLVPCALAVELIHAYSLVHDDLPAMDDDDFRRGRPTLHRRFDEATAILVGDSLQAAAFRVLAEARDIPAAMRVELVALLAEAAGRMVFGQSLDLAAEDRPEIDLEGIDQIQKHKTGGLFGFCLECPGLLAGLGKAQCRVLWALGDRIGVLFQLGDDLIGACGDSTVSGKPNDSDHRNNKATDIA